MRKAIKISAGFFLLLFLSWIIFLNCKLYHRPEFIACGQVEINADVLNKLRFLETGMHQGEADRMQTYFPEGFVFMNALYGLSWCEVAKVAGHSSGLYREAHNEIRFSYSEINSDKGKKIFEKYMPIPYGVFYSGWNNYLLGKKLSIENETERDSNEVNLYHEQSDAIAAALQNPETPFPESYQYAAWPSDVMVAVASLALEKEIGQPVHRKIIDKWLSDIKTRLDTNGLIPHSVFYTDGKPKNLAEGNSQSLILNFLYDIDSSFARQQFNIYKSKFLTTRFGLPAIRQFPDGVDGSGDIDSGPVIFGIGGAASIVGLRTMTIFGEQKTAVGLRNSIEAFGFSSTSNGEKKYLFGKMPMADAFIVWANSAAITKSRMISTDGNWRWKFQLYSLIMVMLSGFALLKMWNVGFVKFKKK